MTGWIFVNLVIPATLPLLILAVVKVFADLKDPYASRAQLLRAVRDGQLGWVAVTFAASCTYELWGFFSGKKAGAPDWTGLVLFMACLFLLLSSLLATLGTLFPFDESKNQDDGFWGWMVHYKLFAGTLFSTVMTGALYALVHFGLPTEGK